MRKLLNTLLLCMLPLLSCNREVEPVNNPAEPDPEGCVRITFACSMPESSPDTKALGETSDLTAMYLAVFGSSGYYKEYVKATQVGEKGTAQRTFYDNEGHSIVKTVDTYVFQADLKLSNTPRTVHFLGNGPEVGTIKIGSAKEVLPGLLCEEGKTAFWQMIYLPEIKARTDSEGNFLSPDKDGEGHYLIHQPGQPYLVSEETQACFELNKDANGNPILDEKGNPTGGIALVRNWAKIVIRNNWGATYTEGGEPASHFIPYSFAVVNVPRRGSIVPYGGKTGFIGPDKDHPNRNYQELAFDALTKADGVYAYKGNLPEGTEFIFDVPSKDAFLHPEDPNYNADGRVVKYEKSKENADDESAVYLYERTVPTSTTPPSYVIIYGKYKNSGDTSSLTPEERENGVDCFFKVDLMDGGEYYPILRNFKYQIEVKSIASKGFDNPQSAANAAGSADVSADVNAAHLSDISDGKRRMAIQPWMSHTFIEGNPEKDAQGNALPDPAQLYVKFYDDITADPPVVNMEYENGNPVTVTLTPAGGGVIRNDKVTVGPPVSTAGDDYGFRPIYFKVSDPGDVAHTQTLRVSCKSWDPDKGDHGEYVTLYREIVLTLQPKQTMKVSCRHNRVQRYAGTEQIVDVQIPDGLVESMFPLVFDVEPQDMTLTPDSSYGNLPVTAGISINPNSDKPCFHFERTLTWDDYRQLRVTVDREDESRWRTFSCYFFTNCENSATDIWVSNKYFNPGHASFSDYRSFKDPHFSTSIPRSTEKDIKVSFGVQKEGDDYPAVYIKLENLAWDGHNKVSGKDYYAYTPAQDDNELTFRPMTMNGDVSVTLFTLDDSYEAVTLKPWRFSNVGFIDAHALPSKPNDQYGSNAIFGMVNSVSDKTVLLGFCLDSGNKEPEIFFDNKTGITYGSNSLKLKNNSLHAAPYNGRDDFYWAYMKTGDSGATTSSFTMRADGYIEEFVSAQRFTGNILSVRASEGTLYSWFNTQATATDIDMSKCKAQVQIDPKPNVASNRGLILEKGKTYQIKVDFYQKDKNGNHIDTPCELAYVQFEYETVNYIPQKHLVAEPITPEESVIYPYMGNNAEYIWSMPRGTKEAIITLKAPNNKDAVIKVLRIWGFLSN